MKMCSDFSNRSLHCKSVITKAIDSRGDFHSYKKTSWSARRYRIIFFSAIGLITLIILIITIIEPDCQTAEPKDHYVRIPLL